MSFDLAVRFLAAQTGEPVTPGLFDVGSGGEMADFIYSWQLLIAKAADGAIASLEYDPDGEIGVDEFFENLANAPFEKIYTFDGKTGRALFDRTERVVLDMMLRRERSEFVLIPRRDLPPTIRQIAAALLVLHGIKAE